MNTGDALILALNPCIDAEWRVDDVLWEEKNNVQSERRWAGGKGVNVVRWLKHLGGKPLLLLFWFGSPRVPPAISQHIRLCFLNRSLYASRLLDL